MLPGVNDEVRQAAPPRLVNDRRHHHDAGPGSHHNADLAREFLLVQRLDVTQHASACHCLSVGRAARASSQSSCEPAATILRDATIARTAATIAHRMIAVYRRGYSNAPAKDCRQLALRSALQHPAQQLDILAE